MMRRVAAAARRLAHQVAHSDVALGYAAVVVTVFTGSRWLGGPVLERVIASSSTNLENLRTHPMHVLVTSAFVIDHASQLLSLLVLVLTYAVAQNRLGRVPLLVSIALGHLLATLSVAPLLAKGINRGWLPESLATVTDVGFSYGLACIQGLLACTVPSGQRRVIYVAVLVTVWSWAVILGPLTVHLTRPTFTDVGHTIALFTGFALATLPGALARAGFSGEPPHTD